MNSYHGTSNRNAAEILTNGVDVSFGGGELGLGFYTGEHPHEAKAWAFHQSGDRTKNVVCFDVVDDDIQLLNYVLLDYLQAGLRRYHIRRTGQTRSYLFGVDMIWAPIVGSERASGDQFKWESSEAEKLLNSQSTTRKII